MNDSYFSFFVLPLLTVEKFLRTQNQSCEINMEKIHPTDSFNIPTSTIPRQTQQPAAMSPTDYDAIMRGINRKLADDIPEILPEEIESMSTNLRTFVKGFSDFEILHLGFSGYISRNYTQKDIIDAFVNMPLYLELGSTGVKTTADYHTWSSRRVKRICTSSLTERSILIAIILLAISWLYRVSDHDDWLPMLVAACISRVKLIASGLFPALEVDFLLQLNAHLLYVLLRDEISIIPGKKFSATEEMHQRMRYPGRLKSYLGGTPYSYNLTDLLAYFQPEITYGKLSNRMSSLLQIPKLCNNYQK